MLKNDVALGNVLLLQIISYFEVYDSQHLAILSEDITPGHNCAWFLCWVFG